MHRLNIFTADECKESLVAMIKITSMHLYIFFIHIHLDVFCHCQREPLEMPVYDPWVKLLPVSLCFTAENPDNDVRHCPGREEGL